MATQVTESKLDLASANVLVVGQKACEQDVLAQMLMGFGVPKIQRRSAAEDALRAAESQQFDLSLIEANMTGVDGYTLISDLRRHNNTSTRNLPIILVCGHLRRSDFLRARDCGAHYIITKPISPQTLFDRVLWLARDRRKFIISDSYIGPDRRTKAYGPPPGTKGRRRDDVSAHLGDAKEANLSQDAVDDFFSVGKVSL